MSAPEGRLRRAPAAELGPAVAATRPQAQRKVTEVAVGVLLRPDRAVLLADRPAGKPYAGYWEFPGGKIEAGESVEHALERELHEELGIDIGPAAPWVTFEFDYPHAYVRLHFRRIRRWRGEPHAREGQRMRFFRIDEDAPVPLLPAAVPILRWLALPAFAAEATVGVDASHELLAALDCALASGLRMLLLRPASGPPLARAALRPLLEAVLARTRACAAQAVLDTRLAQPGEFDGAGLHVAGINDAVPVPGARSWAGIDAVDRAAIERAARCGFDYAVAGPVLPGVGRAGALARPGWHGFAELARGTPLPVYAWGGLDLADVESAEARGAQGVLLPLSAWDRRAVCAR